MAGSVPFKPTDDWRSWGGVERAAHRVATPLHDNQLIAALSDLDGRDDDCLAVGLGRSYGDTCINPGEAILDMTGLDRFIAFDPEAGTLRAQAGVSLFDILALIIPYGFYLPTTPGTRYVTLGGAIANDVHGKNHVSAGTFGRHVRRIGLIRSDGTRIELGPEDNSGLFAATISGLGLTGVIAWAEVSLARIPSSTIRQQVRVFANLDEFFDLSEAYGETHEHAVAWVDCLAKGKNLGRGIYSFGDWDEDGSLKVHPKPKSVAFPLEAPGFLLNRFSLSAFNSLYYRLNASRAGPSTVAYDKFFYPLDAIRNWNRMYGRRGFYQYQSVVPPETARDATREMLSIIAASGTGSFLAVLKMFGAKPSPGYLSFPMEGVTLALDFPNQGKKTLELLGALDRVVMQANGRLYPAKDGRMPRAMFETGYDRLDAFKTHIDPGLGSAFWNRMTHP
ncbi:MAG: FAD-binding oxidoreductase [Pseudomonadota bacterium]